MSSEFNSVSSPLSYAFFDGPENAVWGSFGGLFSSAIFVSGLALMTVLVRPRTDKMAIKTYYSTHPVLIPRGEGKRDSDNQAGLVELMKQKMPSVFGPDAGFKSVPWLPTGDAHTIYTSLHDFSKVDIVDYERVLIGLSDGGLSGLDVSPPLSKKPFEPGEPIILVAHGLTGGSHESYVRATLAVLVAPKEEGGLGMRAVVQNSRGCSKLPILTPRFYNACTTDDVRHAVLWITKTFPGSPIYGIGFSLGANVMTNYVGEEGDACPLSGCISVACPYDFVAGNIQLETHNFMTKYIYNYALGGALQALAARHQHVFLDHPDSPIPREELLEYLAKRRVTLREFDEVLTRRVFGYTDAYDYYAHASSSRVVENIRVPYLGLNALDDPITGEHSLPEVAARMNPWVLLVRTPQGGHLGWFEYAPDGSLRRWYVTPVREFLEALLEYDMKARPTIAFEQREEWTIQLGKPSIRIKPVDPDSLPKPPIEPALTKDGKDPVPLLTRVTAKLFTGW